MVLAAAGLGLVTASGWRSASAQCFEERDILVPPPGHCTGQDWFGSPGLLGSQALIGAMGDDTQGTNSGAVYAYDLDQQGRWVVYDLFFATGANAGDRFGSDVALDGDVAYVGAWLDDEPGLVDCGSAYLFQMVGGSWSFSHRFLADDRRASDSFGEVAAIEDGTVLVGAHRDDVGALADAGSVYAYVRATMRMLSR